RQMADGRRAEVLANASVYLEALGHIVVAWIWLDQALCARKLLDAGDPRQAVLNGKLHACRYFMRWELPRIDPQLDRLEAGDDTWSAMPDDWFH
ncbi:acyl-CoA dehydrogenase C-terminal domain-containing protein, partial [Aquamicrobium sp.]